MSLDRHLPGPWRALAAALILALGLLPTPAPAATEPAAQSTPRPVTPGKSTADHSKFKELQGPFTSGPEVTKACIGCHTEAAKQIHKTTHWTWDYTNLATGQQLGKRRVINNFCVSLSSNEPRCTSCHVGYGWKDDSFDFASEEAVDCLVCHDRSGGYKKFPVDAGHPAYVDKPFPPGSGKIWKAVDLVAVAQSVGPTSRETCGACHFYGGGGDAVKHGDMDSSMANPALAVDVHMSPQGKLNFQCSTCHTADQHAVPGSRYQMTAMDKAGIDVPGRTDNSRATCESCHGLAPHKAEAKLNDHVDVVACESCHIPTFARGGKSTKMWWDWSTAGRLSPEGKPFVTKNDKGEVVYDSMKGDFIWEANVVPDYRFFDGTVRYPQFDGPIDPSGMVPINTVQGGYGDGKSRIWPFKVMKGKQPYDAETRHLAVLHLFGKDPNAYWANFDMQKAAAAGMQRAGLPFSGKLGWVETEYLWPLTHMVAPAKDALACESCHARDGRLAGLTGFYMPGRDRFAWLDMLGWTAAGLTLLGVLGHAALRILGARKG